MLKFVAYNVAGTAIAVAGAVVLLKMEQEGVSTVLRQMKTGIADTATNLTTKTTSLFK